MIKKLILILIHTIINNDIVLKYRLRNIIKNDLENFDFLNLSFENSEELAKIIFSKQYFYKKHYDEKSINYHSFAWLNSARKLGGVEIISLAKKQIINWYNKNYSKFSFVWDENLISKRLINFIYNFDFYSISATNKEKQLLKYIIYKNFMILKLKIAFIKNKYDQPIEISKILLLMYAINNNNTNQVINQIVSQINYQINTHGFHKSSNPSLHAEFINELYEIKNICLHFKIDIPKALEYQIMNMSSVLKNLFHKNNTIALFNGSNNANYEQLIKINNSYKDLKPKNISDVDNGLAVFETKKN